MTNLIKTGQTMTSMQIAEVTGKRHCEVLRAIRNMESAWEKTRGRKFALTFIIKEMPNGATRKDPYYELTKTECLYIATKFNDEARARLILRWEQLENERLTAPQQQAESPQLPPPIGNQQVTPSIVKYVEGKAVTTSRKLAEVLGRKHDSVLETIKNNLRQRAFKYGNFTTRPYFTGAAHGYEFLITRKGLDALAAVMRYNAKERIAQAYEGAWDSPIRGAVLPTTKALPASIQSHDQGEETTHTSEQQEYIDWLEGYNEELGSRLRKTKNTMKLYSELYSQEMNRRKRAEGMSGYWHDLYEDLMLRMENMGDNAPVHLLESHRAFRLRLGSKG